MYTYVAYGLSLHSTIPLPELKPDQIECEPDVHIVPMKVSPAPPAIEEAGLVVWHTEEGVVLHWKYFGTYRVRGGEQIEYAPNAGLSAAAIRVPILGVCLGILLYQRGFLTLHASAVQVNGAVLAFVGEKGAGKSTTTAALVQRGHELVADDVVAIGMDGVNGVPLIPPGLATMKLWPQSLTAIGVDPEAVPRLHEEVEKRLLRAPTSHSSERLPLRCVYVLEQGEAIASSEIPPREAFVEAVRHTYAARFLGAAAGDARHFQQCTSLVRSVPMRRLVRTDNVEQVEELVRHIEAEWGAKGAA